MATDKDGTWSEGESVLWYSPTNGIDATWSEGESYILDEYGGITWNNAVISKWNNATISKFNNA